MAVEYEVLIRSTKHPAAILDRPLPGKEFAEEIQGALEKLAVEVLGVFDEEPFWELRCSLNGKSIAARLALSEPNVINAHAAWYLSFEEKSGFLIRLLGRGDAEDVRQFSRKMHLALESLDHVVMIRWFSGGSFNPVGGGGAFSPSDLGGAA